MTRAGWFTVTAMGISRALGDALVSEAVAREPGLLQSLDPRVRVVGLFSLVLAAILTHTIPVLLVLFALAVAISLLSCVSLAALATRVWLVVLFFTGVIALPALFLTPGTPLSEHSFWGSRITQQGLNSATLLLLRVETAATLTTLLVLTTPWMYLLKSLRAFRIPPEVVMMLAMTHRYVFLLAETAGQMFESRRSRTVGALSRADRRRVTAQTAGVLLSKSVELSNEVYQAMQSRGFRGEARVLDDFRLRGRDYLGLTVLLATSILAVWMGRP
jgi:cobalt ECF transporter T component CbiQ